MKKIVRSWRSPCGAIVIFMLYVILKARKTAGQCGGHPLLLQVDHMTKFTVETPGYPTGYNTSLTCTWTVDVRNRSDALLIQVVNTDVSCGGDGVTITEESSGTKRINLFCGYGGTSTRVVSFLSGQATIQFVSNAIADLRDKGLQVLILSVPNKTTDACQPTKTVQSREDEQFIYSTNFPEEYASPMSCQWTIQLNSGYNLQLIIYFEDFEHDSACAYDYMEITTVSSRVVRKSCKLWDFSQTADKLSEINETTVVTIKSDDSNGKRGVMLGYRAIKIGENPTTTTITTTTTTTTTTTEEKTTTTSQASTASDTRETTLISTSSTLLPEKETSSFNNGTIVNGTGTAAISHIAKPLGLPDGVTAVTPNDKTLSTSSTADDGLTALPENGIDNAMQLSNRTTHTTIFDKVISVNKENNATPLPAGGTTKSASDLTIRTTSVDTGKMLLPTTGVSHDTALQDERATAIDNSTSESFMSTITKISTASHEQRTVLSTAVMDISLQHSATTENNTHRAREQTTREQTTREHTAREHATREHTTYNTLSQHSEATENSVHTTIEHISHEHSSQEHSIHEHSTRGHTSHEQGITLSIIGNNDKIVDQSTEYTTPDFSFETFKTSKTLEHNTYSTNKRLSKSNITVQTGRLREDLHVCSVTACVVPLVLAISILIGVLCLALVIIGSTRRRKQKRKYNIADTSKNAPNTPQLVLPVVIEMSDEECSL